MRLLHFDHSGRLVSTNFAGKSLPPYAILSHRWGDSEVLFEDVRRNTYKEKGGYRKIEFCAEQAAQDQLQYFWIDTCCIDKVLQSGAVEGSRRAGGASNGDEKEGAWGRAAGHADQHGQSGVDVQESGAVEEAEELFVQVIEARKRVLGDEHPNTLTSLANLASTFCNQGRWKEAEELFVQVMETSSRVLGDEHPSTLTSMANLAFTLKSRGS